MNVSFRLVSVSAARHAFTLLEVLVAIGLTALVLSLALPLLRAIGQPASAAQTTPTWQSVLLADVAQRVPASKCGVPTVRLISATDSSAFPSLTLQTFCRSGGNGTRGPAEVTYRLEPLNQRGPYGLVRTARGWHDDYAERYVLLTGVMSWDLTWRPAIVAPATAPAPENATTALAEPTTVDAPGLLTVHLTTGHGAIEMAFWMPMETLPPPATRPQEGGP